MDRLRFFVLLLISTAVAADVAQGELDYRCPLADTGAATVCSMDATDSCQGGILAGDVLVTANGGSTWDLGAGLLSFAPDANVTVACLSISLEQPMADRMEVLPPNISSLYAPWFIQPTTGQLSSLTLRDVELMLSCPLLLEWQRYLCGTRLPGTTKVEGNVISIGHWQDGGMLLERVNLTCRPEGGDFASACAMKTVDGVSDILEASSRLQIADLPLVLIVSRGLTFNDSNWPEMGLRITANVTLSATLKSRVTISFGLRTVLFTVDSKSSATAFLSFRGCILMDLPLSYLPLNHPRRPFGVLSTSLWPVYRDDVAMGLYNCTLILTHEEFKFWSFWLSILISPIPGVRAMGNWSYANGVKLDPSGADYIQLASYYGRYTTLVDVRYQVTNDEYATQQRNNILQITNNAQVPPTVVFQTRDSDDLVDALQSQSSSAASQHGLYVILTGNLTMMNETQWPSGGVALRYPTTITTWPSSWVAFDLRLLRDAFVLLPISSASVSLKNIVLLNLAAGPEGTDVAGLTTGLWAFNLTNWRNVDQQRISLERAVMVVSKEEVEYYIDAAVTRKQTDSWMSSFQVESYDRVNRSWVHFASLATGRFTAQALNISNTMPDMFNSDAVNVTLVPGLTRGSNVGGGGDDPSRREILLFAVLAITLPTALGAALMTFLFLKRRRLSQLCTMNNSEKAKHDQQSSDAEDEESDADDGEAKSSPKVATGCCFTLSLPLRKSKFVNPLYNGAGGAPPDIVLTGVLGPVALARSLATVPPEPAAAGAGAGSTPTGPAEPALLPADLGAAPAADGNSMEQESDRGGVVGARTGTSGTSRALCVLSVAPADLRQGREVHEGLAEAAAESGISSLSESCAQGFGMRRDSSAGHGSDSVRLSAMAAAPVLDAAPRPPDSITTACAAAAGAPYGQGSRAAQFSSSAHDRGGRQEHDVGQPTVVDVASAASDQEAGAEAQQNGTVAGGQDGGVQRLALLARQASGRQASPSGNSRPTFFNQQQLERLRQEIGDRHLEVQHSLGWGGCGVVYKGVWKGLQVAVKTILLQGDGRQSQQFLTEAAISASLQHANIVTTYLYELRPLDEVDTSGRAMDVRVRSGSSDGISLQDIERMSCWKLYIVQEYCELGTLKAAIDQGYFKGPGGGPPNLGFLLTIALDVALGLTHVHSKNVVHGDVTVSNVLLQGHPGRPHGCIAKVADFGLSVKFEQGQSQGYHMYGGTPHYMAPERVRGVLSKQSDMYSLGVCLWELYCGTPPWRRNAAGAHHRGYGGTTTGSVDSGNQLDLEGAGCSSESFRFPRKCPTEYASLVLSCLSQEPQSRPTAAAVASTLQRLHRRYA